MKACTSRKVASIGLVVCIACAGRKKDPGPQVQIVGESSRLRLDAPAPATSPWFDGARVVTSAARGEIIGLQVLHRDGLPATLTLSDPHVTVRSYAVEHLRARRGSTSMYGGSQGPGEYADGLTPSSAPATDPAYFELEVAREAPPGVRTGELAIGARRYPVELTVVPVTLPPLPLAVWAYGDPRELAWAAGGAGDPPRAEPSAAERACMDVFRSHGVLLSPDLQLDWWPQRRAGLAGVHDLPVVLDADPQRAGDQVRGWIDATRGTGSVPFAIPIDEPRTPEARARVRALAEVVRAAGGGPNTFRFAVTDEPRPEYGDLVDLYITLTPHLTGDLAPRWTYNGAPPRAGSMVLDALTPGTRTWGWIAWRWKIPRWYVWDALYWHDRHNRKGAPLPGRAFSRDDAISFDDGEDHGNLDGVLAFPAPGGCRPTLRLAALRRGQQDRSLLDLAAACDPTATAALAASLVPRALGDAPQAGAPSWPTDEAAWEQARRKLLALASCR